MKVAIIDADLIKEKFPDIYGKYFNMKWSEKNG